MLKELQTQLYTVKLIDTKYKGIPLRRHTIKSLNLLKIKMI